MKCYPANLCSIPLPCLVLFALTLTPSSWAQNEGGSGSRHIQSFQLLSNRQARINLTRSTNEAYTLLTGTNLVEWTPVVLGPPDSTSAESATHTIDLIPEWGQAFYQVSYRDLLVNPVPLTNLDGPPTGAVSEYLPDMGMPLVDEGEVEFVKGVLPISLAHVLVTIPDSTTVQSLNDLLVAENLSLAGAVPLMKLAVLRRNEVTNLEDLDELMARLRTTGLFSTVADDFGLSIPEKVEEVPLESELAQSQVPHLRWTWDPIGLGLGTDGNSFFEMSRIPQLWNWLDYGHRQKEFLGSHDVAVLEFAFYDHNDFDENVVLDYSQSTGLGTNEFNHGAAVLGVIAARHDTRGVQGVTTLPNRVVGHAFPVNTTGTNAYSGVYLGQLASIVSHPSHPKVINISSGMKWITRNIGQPTNTFRSSGQLWSTWMDNHGQLWADCFASVNQDLSDTNYLVVSAAGNEFGVNARYASPMANIACRLDVERRPPQFLTAESVDGMRQTSWFSDYDHSGVGDAVSAGGHNVTVLQGPGFNTYDLHASGTSFSAPLVTGLASFLWTLEPSLTIAEMKSLLTSSNTTFDVQQGKRGNLVDGYSAALEIDRWRGNHERHTALVDVDDGTLDGNLRMRALETEEDPDLIHNFDGRRGDGLVNMKDFRAFRDAWLQVIGETNHLDGPLTHYKRDLNYDGLVVDQAVMPAHPAPYEIGSRGGAVALAEEVYSRFDFNGNGRLDFETEIYNPSTNAISPVKIDPDTMVTKRNVRAGMMRDLDVLLDPVVWSLDDENMAVNGDEPDWDFLSGLPPDEWTTNVMREFTFYSSKMPYMWSFDLHVDMEGGDPVNGANIPEDYVGQLVSDGLWIDSFYRMQKARLGEWQGVVTIPFTDPTDVIYQVSPTNFPWVGIYYKKTVGDEYHQYRLYFGPQAGEDIALVVGFDKLEFRSTTREFSPGLTEFINVPAQEIIAKNPATAPYSTFFVAVENFTSFEEDIVKPARDLAISALADRLRSPRALNGSPELVPIYETQSSEIGYTVQIYGLTATYESP